MVKQSSQNYGPKLENTYQRLPNTGKNKENQTNKISEIIFLVSSKHGHFLCKI